MSFYPSTVFFGEGRHGRERCGNENALGWSYNTTAVGFCGRQCEYNSHARADALHTHCLSQADKVLHGLRFGNAFLCSRDALIAVDMVAP